jgi:serine/threonine protein kinase
MIGERILNYKIESRLGEGGVGTVYLASHTQLGRKVAIKVLNPALVDNADIRERFRNEATTLSALQHVNIITLYDYLEQEKELFLIMEYAPGQSLDSYIHQITGPIPEQKTIYFFEQILDGFAYAHQKGVVHRDIKPSNIIVTPDSDIKILDFGIAKILKEGKRNLTKTGTQLGTVLYMSPEQVQGRFVDQRTDIYSLGLTLFEMITGKCPYDEDKLTEYEVYEKILKEPLPSTASFYPGVSPKIQQIIAKATAKDPQDRYQSCEEFKEAFGQVSKPIAYTSSNTTQTKTNYSNTPKSEKAVPISSPRVSKSSDLDRLKRKNNLVLYSIVVILMALTTWIAWYVFSEKPTPVEDDSELVVENDVTEDDISTPKDDDYENEDRDRKSLEDILLDSLNQKKERTQDFLKLLRSDRESELLKGLLIDGQVEEGSSTQFLGEFVIQVTVANRREDARFEDLMIAITYFDDSNKELKTKEQGLEPLGAGKSITFRVREDVNAAKFTTKLKKVKVIDLEPTPVIDSLNTQLNKINDKIKEVREQMDENF